MDEERILSPSEVQALMNDLQRKHGADIDRVMKQIQSDVATYGFVTTETTNAQKSLSDKILSESMNAKQ